MRTARHAPAASVVGIVGDVQGCAGLDAERPTGLPAATPVAGPSHDRGAERPPSAGAVDGAGAARRLCRRPEPARRDVRTLDEIVAKSISQPRFYMTLLGIFAAVALVLAAIGIFGVLSYAVAQRTREIGIRMALGAQEGSVVRLVVRQAMMLVMAGVVVGHRGALVLSRTLTKMLFQREPARSGDVRSRRDHADRRGPRSCYVPARRATRVDPIVALAGVGAGSGFRVPGSGIPVGFRAVPGCPP